MSPARRGRGMRGLLHPLYRKLETKVHPLRYLFLEITQRCNLKCRHCGSDCIKQSRLDELTADEWLAFLAYLERRMDTRQLVLVITGGEPLCHPELDRILGGIREHRLAWGMVSNGYALSAANVQKVKAAGIASATVSLDGLAKSHDWLRGVAGSFKRAVAGIERLVAARLPFLDVVTCVHPGNLAELPDVLALLRKLGVARWRLFSIFPKGRARGSSELLLGADGLKQFLGFIAAQRAELSGSGFSLNFSCEAYLPAETDRAVRDEPYFCRAGISIGSVLCDGAISACPNVSRSFVQGNIRSDDFATVWEERFVKLRDRSWMRTGRCAGCGEWKRCLGNSLHLWDDEAAATALCTYQAVQEPGRRS